MENQNDSLKASLGDVIGATSGKVDDYLLKDHTSPKGRRSQPLLGLPLRRALPQDLHSLLDYTNGLALVVSGSMSDSKAAGWAGTLLGSMLIGVSAITDYRLSLAKIVPIEMHEVSDYIGGLSAIAAPFAFGYHRRSRAATWVHVAVGVSSIAASLFTDYRAWRGIGRR